MTRLPKTKSPPKITELHKVARPQNIMVAHNIASNGKEDRAGHAAASMKSKICNGGTGKQRPTKPIMLTLLDIITLHPPFSPLTRRCVRPATRAESVESQLEPLGINVFVTAGRNVNPVVNMDAVESYVSPVGNGYRSVRNKFSVSNPKSLGQMQAERQHHFGP